MGPQEICNMQTQKLTDEKEPAPDRRINSGPNVTETPYVSAVIGSRNVKMAQPREHEPEIHSAPKDTVYTHTPQHSAQRGEQDPVHLKGDEL